MVDILIKNFKDQSWFNDCELKSTNYETMALGEMEIDDYWKKEDKSQIFSKLSTNKNLTYEFLINHLTKSWDWYTLFKKIRSFSSLTKFRNLVDQKDPAIIKKYVCLVSKYIPFKIIKAFPDLDWNWNSISTRKHLPFDLIKNHKNKLWCWDYLSNYNYISLKFIEQNLDKPWDWHMLIKRFHF